MPKKEYDAYSLFCKSLDTMGSALAFGSSLARAAAQANEQMTQAWEFPDRTETAEEQADEAAASAVPEGPSAIELAREAVNRTLEELTGVPALETESAETAVEEPEPKAAAPKPAPSRKKVIDPVTTTQQADELDDRAKRLLARFVEPDPDFFEKSPFEGWDAFDETSQKPN